MRRRSREVKQKHTCIDAQAKLEPQPRPQPQPGTQTDLDLALEEHHLENAALVHGSA